jgi:Spy/CpxP family protein refolding chaperone
MKKTLLVLTIAVVTAFAGTSTLMARGWGGGYGGGICGGPGAGMGQSFHHIDRMQYFLGLSDEQADKIYKIDREYQDKYYQNRKNYDAIENLREEHRKAILNVLTKEQKEKWENFLKDSPGRYDRRGHWGSGSRW